MRGSGCKESSHIPTNSSHSLRCWHLLPLQATREERDMRHRMGTTEITLTAALAKLWLPQPCSFLPAGNSGAEPATPSRCPVGLDASREPGAAAGAAGKWQFPFHVSGCQLSPRQRAGGCGRGATGYRHAGPHSSRDAAGSHFPATGNPRRPPGPAAGPEAACQPCTRVPISGPDSQPCASRAPCPAVPVSLGVPSELRVPRSHCSPAHPRAACAAAGPRGAPGGGTRPPRPAPSRPVPPRLLRPGPAPLRPVPARHSTARQRPGERPAARHRSDRTGPDGWGGGNRGQWRSRTW